ncbi:hypothetical protein NKY44_08990 [Sinorhizobium meliloti]|uniref:hypothetical protein n=1 Tax=Rhizobium meliloti TaxID=382 RepID=UPI003D656BAD
MSDFLRIYVLWAHESEEGRRLANLISDHFDGIGMERDGVAVRVPVRFRSEPWEIDGVIPRTVDLDHADHNVIVVLHDGYMQENAVDWDEFVSAIRSAIDARSGADVYVPFGSPDHDPPLKSDSVRHTQYARRDVWMRTLPDETARDARFLLHLVFTIRQHLKTIFGGSGDEPLFVSHAKADGDSTARAVIDYVNDSSHDVPLQTFYDAMELAPGEDYEARFVSEISKGTLLAIVSDVYDSRPWCVFELTTAKRARRPIVLADVGQVRTSRTYPYGANLPKVRVTPEPGRTGWIEQLLVHTLSEGLRCDVFGAQALRRAKEAGLDDVLILPRPPELFDLVDSTDIGGIIVYPDPPVGQIEAELLRKALGLTGRGTDIRTLSEVR